MSPNLSTAINEAKFRFERTRSFRCSSLDGKKTKKQSVRPIVSSVALWWAHLYIRIYCDWSGIVFFIMLQVRHDNKDQLEKIKDTVVLIEQKISSAVTLDTHSSRLASMKATKFSSCTRAVGSSCPVYIMPLADDKWALTFFLDNDNIRICVWNAKWNEWMWSSHFLTLLKQRWKDAMITFIHFFISYTAPVSHFKVYFSASLLCDLRYLSFSVKNRNPGIVVKVFT